MPQTCSENQRLLKEAQVALSRISQLSNQQVGALQDRDHDRVHALDNELELAFGEKERTMGALDQHRREHGC